MVQGRFAGRIVAGAFQGDLQPSRIERFDTGRSIHLASPAVRDVDGTRARSFPVSRLCINGLRRWIPSTSLRL